MSNVIPLYANCCVPHDFFRSLIIFVFPYHISTTTSTNTTNANVFLKLDVTLFAKNLHENAQQPVTQLHNLNNQQCNNLIIYSTKPDLRTPKTRLNDLNF